MTYSRSSGPGGQNVNKINSKVDLRFHLASAEWLSSELKEKVAARVIMKVFVFIFKDYNVCGRMRIFDFYSKEQNDFIVYLKRLLFFVCSYLTVFSL